mmetsp:Transcript_23481/g.74471  ORF Transcript_23481/g.74471 Transcript_23481/m.74471 type:complete len:134 (+) Transcript_23481:165-566(+)|eukprot:CAMPEP_0185288176 /NCGR_PEP_ID=MMETSP1363-20130426/3245_1 /TAXON_ID=38817 /ORGANISM="Gephyrocapsa oceanica, Strain RCC1303" /LENGTH=133 /DNA_ID=CAMNT_0027884043 /DNA_START=109 /DNA_END=510 /DNA_ORIENTATION=-
MRASRRSTTLLAARCLERFIGDLVDRAAAVAEEEGAKLLTTAHLVKCVEAEELSFLQSTVHAFNAAGASAAPARKRTGGGGGAAAGSKRRAPGIDSASASELQAAAASLEPAAANAMVGADLALAQGDDDYDD